MISWRQPIEPKMIWYVAGPYISTTYIFIYFERGYIYMHRCVKWFWWHRIKQRLKAVHWMHWNYCLWSGMSRMPCRCWILNWRRPSQHLYVRTWDIVYGSTYMYLSWQFYVFHWIEPVVGGGVILNSYSRLAIYNHKKWFKWASTYLRLRVRRFLVEGNCVMMMTNLYIIWFRFLRSERRGSITHVHLLIRGYDRLGLWILSWTKRAVPPMPFRR